MLTNNKILAAFGVVGAIAVLYVASLYALKVANTPLYSAPTPPAGGSQITSRPIQNPFGILTARTASSITISAVGNVALTFTIASTTDVLEGTSTAKKGSLVVGVLVSVVPGLTDATGHATAKTITIIPPPPSAPGK